MSDPRTDDATALGERLAAATGGAYDVLGEVGRGGMAAVYLARDVALDRFVALKVMAPELLAAPSMVDRFVAEARTVARLRHPNVVTVYAVVARAGLHCFVMEYVEGRTLADVIADARASGRWPSLDARVRVLAQVARALQYAHDQGVVHRDVKPGNIMLAPDGRPVVMDFGIAKVAADAGLTQSGVLLGTPSYMSPEQCEGRADLSGAADQYALGVVAYEMLAGAPPFTGSPVTVMHAHMTAPVPPLDLARAACPAALGDVVIRMLAKVPDARFPSLGDAADALERALRPAGPNGAPHAVAHAGPDGVPVRRAGRVAAVLAACALAACALALAGGVAAVAADSARGPVPARGPPAPGTQRTAAPGSGAVDAARARLAVAAALSRAGEYADAADSLDAVARAVRALADARPPHPATAELDDDLRRAVRENQARCASYARLLTRRGRAGPACGPP